LAGSSIGQDLLKARAIANVPTLTNAIRCDALQIAGRGFRSATKRFGVFPAATVLIAAVQRDWRGFRIAPCSRERDDATLPKIWTRSAWSRSREQEPWRLQ
jgi:hypothetical protein